MAETLTVEQAWSAVMGDVQGIGKHQRNEQQRFNFRGIDAVVNAVGPVLREHGVMVIPRPESITTTTYQTKTGTTMFSATVKMAYTVRGPAGDTFEGGAYGEAADAGDKAVSKAQSVAYRVFLLQGLTIPTDEPDPDHETHERAQPPSLQPNQVALADAVRARGLSSEQKIQFRAELLKAGLPQSMTDMDEIQAFDALVVLGNTFSQEAQ